MYVKIQTKRGIRYRDTEKNQFITKAEYFNIVGDDDVLLPGEVKAETKVETVAPVSQAEIIATKPTPQIRKCELCGGVGNNQKYLNAQVHNLCDEDYARTTGEIAQLLREVSGREKTSVEVSGS